MKLCLLHGKWHDSSSWDEIVALLRARGADVVAPDMPFEDPATTYSERIEPVLGAIGEEPAVLVGHSLAAAYAPLVAVARPGSTLIYLCPAPVLPLRTADSPSGYRPGFPFPETNAEGLSIWEREAALRAMYPRVPRDKALAAVERLKPGASASDEYPLTEHPDVPARLIYAAQDEFFEPEFERWTAVNVLHSEPIEIPGGHFPMLADPEALADLLMRLA